MTLAKYLSNSLILAKATDHNYLGYSMAFRNFPIFFCRDTADLTVLALVALVQTSTWVAVPE